MINGFKLIDRITCMCTSSLSAISLTKTTFMVTLQSPYKNFIVIVQPSHHQELKDCQQAMTASKLCQDRRTSLKRKACSQGQSSGGPEGKPSLQDSKNCCKANNERIFLQFVKYQTLSKPCNAEVSYILG